jgi:HTH-type transcriptional regulator, competence development regulator
MADPRKIFGDLLRATRVAKGYSLRKFAEMADMSPTYLSQVEQGKIERPPTAERVRTMAELLGQNADEWIGLAGRVSDDLTDIIKNEPQAMPALLRAVKGLTADELRKLTEQIRDQQKDGGKEE